MTTLALALVLAATDPDLPRVLGDDVAPPAITQFYDLPAWSLEPQAARGQHAVVFPLPRLPLEGSIDIQTEQSYENGDIHIFLFPVQFTALFYPPVDWPVRPYGLGGSG